VFRGAANGTSPVRTPGGCCGAGLQAGAPCAPVRARARLLGSRPMRLAPSECEEARRVWFALARERAQVTAAAAQDHAGLGRRYGPGRAAATGAGAGELIRGARAARRPTRRCPRCWGVSRRRWATSLRWRPTWAACRSASRPPRRAPSPPCRRALAALAARSPGGWVFLYMCMTTFDCKLKLVSIAGGGAGGGALCASVRAALPVASAVRQRGGVQGLAVAGLHCVAARVGRPRRPAPAWHCMQHTSVTGSMSS